MSAEPTISAAQVAVLAERVDTVIQNHSRMEGMLMGMSTTHQALVSQIAVVQERLVQSAAASIRAAAVADTQGECLDELKRDVGSHKTIWRIIAGCSGLALALVAFGYTEVRNIAADNTRQDSRLTLLEFINGGRNPPAAPVARTPDQQ